MKKLLFLQFVLADSGVFYITEDGGVAKGGVTKDKKEGSTSVHAVLMDENKKIIMDSDTENEIPSIPKEIKELILKGETEFEVVYFLKSASVSSGKGKEKKSREVKIVPVSAFKDMEQQGWQGQNATKEMVAQNENEVLKSPGLERNLRMNEKLQLNLDWSVTIPKESRKSK